MRKVTKKSVFFSQDGGRRLRGRYVRRSGNLILYRIIPGGRNVVQGYGRENPFSGRDAVCRDAIHRVRKNHLGILFDVYPGGRDASRPYVWQSYCDFNTICFWRKIVVSLQQLTGRTAMVRPVFVENSWFYRVFSPKQGRNYMACSFSQMPCRCSRPCM